jgi:aminocarboxymuconate-semialdehyde decarboxylase
MPNRREFLKTVAGTAVGTAAGALISTSAFADARLAGTGRAAAALRFPQGQAAAPTGPVKRREVSVAGKRVKVVDVHSHCTIPEVADVVAGTALARNTRGGGGGGGQVLGPDRLRALDERGIDVQVLDINGFWWYAADRDLASKIVDLHNEKMAAWCNAHSDRFVALTSVALQFPDLAAQQLEHAVKQLGMRGAAIGGHVAGEPLSSPKFDPFWAKAEELGVLVFEHPGGAQNVLKEDGLKGTGDLGNIIGDPLETTVFFSHLIFDGTFDKFPGLKICGAHAGGYLPSYLGRTEVACDVRANAKCVNKKKPSDYMKKNLMADAMIFSSEGVRHMVAEMGASQVVYGTDIPFNWPDGVDFIVNANITNAEKEMVLGGNLVKLLKI